MADGMMQSIIAEQNKRLIDYAKAKIIEIGDQVRTYHSKNHMDRTGHLLDSLCWGVSYNGKLIEGGFYRDAMASGNSYLHEWLSGDVKYLMPVDGREQAQRYLTQYGNNGTKGWRVFFAILAPYWGYWEKGFRMPHNFTPKDKNGKPSSAYGKGIRSFYQFAVMTQFYDIIKRELRPARTRFRVSVAKYDRQKLEKRWNRYAQI